VCYVLNVVVFPLGHPVELVGHCDSLVHPWPQSEQQFDVKPLRFSLELRESGDASGAQEFLPAKTGFRVRSGSAGAGEFSLASRSGTLRATEVALQPLLELLVLTALDWTFFIGVHAACVTNKGRSVLLLGDSHAGKSTLAYACSQAGWTFVSDNSLHWADSPWDILVSGSSTLRLREGARAMFGVSESEILPRKHAKFAQPGPCVFLRRRPGKAKMMSGSVEDAMRYLEQYDTRPDRTFAEQRYKTLLSHGVWELQYQSVDDAVRCLESL
jgi:hypothetical protein